MWRYETIDIVLEWKNHKWAQEQVYIQQMCDAMSLDTAKEAGKVVFRYHYDSHL